MGFNLRRKNFTLGGGGFFDARNALVEVSFLSDAHPTPVFQKCKTPALPVLDDHGFGCSSSPIALKEQLKSGK